ncbi:hypothetical protein DENIS_2770 [Desulfonema ishimotonii]|uniref:Apea-like HEPN domain-containing protein n=2 Tax=Desulfonema ishimotonii TaxID=45657 RepID=A0A401FXV7_9BACT|nr:hypothetical protein DENIS_2770 [Desulfonema ishimotonii]
MRFRNLKKWKNLKNLEGLLFFAQRMEELLFDYSLDTYKPLALNAPFLCQETLELISDIDKSIIDSANLKHVLEELTWSLQNDNIAKSLLDVDIERYILDSEETKLSEKEIRLEVLSKTLSPSRYLKRCYELLSSSVKDVKKTEIDTYSKTLITTLTNIGINKQYLYNKILDFFFLGDSPNISSVDQIDDFLNAIAPRIHEFDIFFISSSLINSVADSIKAFKIGMHKELPEELREYALNQNFIAKNNEIYVEIKNVNAFDSYSARKIADIRLDNLSDLFTLFYHKKQISWKEETLIRQCYSDELVIIGSPKNSMEKGFDLKPAKASKQLNLLIENFSFRKNSFEKFNRIVDFHGISVNNDIIENQLLNIWISLETITPSQTGNAKIKNVVSSAIPFIVTNYITRLIERFTADLFRWNKFTAKNILRKLPDTKGDAIYIKVLKLLGIEDNESIRKELYDSLGDFHLLRYRTFQLSKVLKSPKKVIELIDSHEKKVSWQIRRIYRTRNLIVHSGRTPKYIHTLVENGHDYLDQLLFEVIKLSCNDYEIESFEQVFELVKIRYHKYKRALSDIEKFDGDNIVSLLNYT